IRTTSVGLAGMAIPRRVLDDVLKQQPVSTSEVGVRRALNDMLAINGASLPWKSRKQGDDAGAWQFYCASLRRALSGFDLKVSLLTMIHSRTGGMGGLVASRMRP